MKKSDELFFPCFLEIFKISSGFLLFILLLVFSTGCVYKKKIEHLSGWIVYWDVDKGIKELDEYIHFYDQINVFAVDLTPDGDLVFPPGFEELLEGVTDLAGKADKKIFITVVNDIRDEQNTGNRLKDPKVVHYILSSSERMDKHIEQLTQLVEETGVHGLDIDYENLFIEDYEAFYSFVKKLAVRLRENGKEFELTVEPENFIHDRERLEGIAEIIPLASKINIMGYNLHYPPYTKPGPRATPHWLSSLSRSAINVSRDYSWTIALATHGFEWGQEKGRSISLKEIGRLTKELWIKPERDKISQVPHFQYIDRHGKQRIVWYEDESSFKEKWRQISKTGVTQIALWRIGGNSKLLYSFLEQHK